MAKLAKLLQAAAGAAGGAGLNVEEVFSTYLYTGGISGVTNGIDLDGEGGMVWGKQRTGTGYPWIFDTERGHSKWLYTNDPAAEQSGSTGISSFNSDGFSLQGTSTFFNSGTQDYASWTFRKAPKFFDVVTYTGTGSAQTISHNLGSVPGMIIVKATSTTENWAVYHRSLGATKALRLNLTNAQTGSDAYWNNTEPTSTQFTVGNGGHTGANGTSYVAYLFAHNDGDGEFGPDGDADIIKCGSFVQGTGSYDVDLGFEPQWVLIKSATSVTNWMLFDNMRGLVAGGNDAILKANTSAAEENTDPYLSPTSTGFTSHLDQITGNQTYIYIAIRRGPMAVPESATDVFDIYQNESTATVPAWQHPFPVDFGVYKAASNVEDWWSSARLTQDRTLRLNTADAENTSSAYDFDYMDGWLTSTTTQTDYHSWAWRRAPNFFDVVAYTGNGTAGRTVSHNLGVAPEMMWVKSRNVGSTHWVVYHSGLGNDKFAYLSATNAAFNDASPTAWDFTTPSSADFTLGAQTGVNQPLYNYIAYLFASLDGVSKVGSYTGDGNTEQNIDCGFSSGARFVLIKKTSSAGSWFLFDSERGIISGNSPYLQLNQTSAQGSSYNELSPYSSGFTVRNGGGLNLNFNGHTFIFYAIA